MLSCTHKREPAPPPDVKLVRAIVIDPFKCELVPLIVNWADQRYIHNLLDCDLVQQLMFGGALRGVRVAIYVDECALIREPFVYPQFKVASVNGEHPITGYGLVVGWFEGVVDCPTSVAAIAGTITWEHHWQRRINPDLCIDQVLRVYFGQKW
jgi:hypothetical protein